MVESVRKFRPMIAGVPKSAMESTKARMAPDDTAGALLSDADLSVLALNRGRYHVYVRDVRDEYARFDDEQFAKGRLRVIDDLLGREQLFRTERGRALWQQAARATLAEERTRWPLS